MKKLCRKQKNSWQKKAAYKHSLNKKTCEKIASAGRHGSRMFWNEVKRKDYKGTISELVINNTFITEKEEILAEVEMHFQDQAEKK